jgi:ABC-2 type transport system ATP-binding protein
MEVSMDIVEVTGLTKIYPAFQLREVSFSLEAGKITGFIGRNGAGKTTTIKSMLNLVHADRGEISYFGMPLIGNETEIKQRIGYQTGTVSWYPRKTMRDIVEVTRTFYRNWDEDAYRRYMTMFGLDESKKPIELSEGMKVKFNLLLALSHRAEILILDEPTSGLDPFSRDELLELFETLKEHGVTILFSTHITSDLEKCADNIIYISEGMIKASCSVGDFVRSYGRQGETLEEIFLRQEREARS